MDPESLLRQAFGHPHFRGSQREIIDHLLAGRHAMVVMPTGMGKSLCYQIPALTLAEGSGELVVVLSPLIALMQDQVDGLVRRGIDATLINSSLDRRTRQARMDELAAGRFRLLYVTPERFRKADFRQAIAGRTVRWLAVDEAHCVSQWGHDFRPDYTRLAEIRQAVGDPPTVALTATATAACRRDIVHQLGIAADDIRLFHRGIERPNLELEVRPVWGDEGKLAAIRECLSDPAIGGGSVILYFSLIRTLERFAEELGAAGIAAERYHGDLSRGERRRVHAAFMSGDADLVLATNAFGMGVDKPDIRLVVHVETPGSIESYYQEIGRAGRDGRPSRCVWLYDQDDLATQMRFIEWSNPDADFYGRLMHLLEHHHEACIAFGPEWLSGRLQRVSRHDHRLDTAIAMLDRHGVVAGPRPPECFRLRRPLPDEFRDDRYLAEKKRRDQMRLYSMVRFAGETGDRKRFLDHYFLDDENLPDRQDLPDDEPSPG